MAGAAQRPPGAGTKPPHGAAVPPEDPTQASLRYSIFDGMFANLFATLTGGVFLTGFALYLGMNEIQIGLLGAMPFLVTVFQLPAAYVVDRHGHRRAISTWCSLTARTLWVPILAVVLVPAPDPEVRIPIVLALVFLHYALGSVSFVSWLSWMSDLVPDRMRGIFFGTRNMIAGAASMVVMVVFGSLLDGLEKLSPAGMPLGFCVTFLSAVLFGWVSVGYLRRVSEPGHVRPQAPVDLSRHFLQPFRNRNFRRFLGFAFSWGFSVYFASPFFALYFLRDLGFGYGFVATMGMLSAFADLVGMRLWGKLSDTTKNKPIIHFAGWWAAFLPLAWCLVGPESVVLPIVIHVLGGGMWAGINLCANNLLLRISPREERALYVSTYSIAGGLGAALGPILAGALVQAMGRGPFDLFGWAILPLQVVFLVSTGLRLLSLQGIRRIREPEEFTMQRMLRILRGVRGLNMSSGFNFLLHPFIDISAAFDRERSAPRDRTAGEP